MTFLPKFLNVLVVVSQLCSPTTQEDPQLSLWGTAAEFKTGCKYWRLKPEVSIPSLQEFTVCFHLLLQERSLFWTAFMYRHPDKNYAELGVGSKFEHFVIWLFGEEWTVQLFDIELSSWHSVCVTWSHAKDGPAFYFNGKPVTVSPAFSAKTSPLVSSSRQQLAANGSLTLGAAHIMNGGNIVDKPFNLPGRLSLFRMWSRERSVGEVTSLACTEGDLVKWKVDNWDTQRCALTQDSTLQCEWSSYQVELNFIIFRYDGNDTLLHTAEDLALSWLRSVLPSNFYLHRVSVFESTRSDREDLMIVSHGRTLRATPTTNRFRSLVRVSVSPSRDVAAVQSLINTNLGDTFTETCGILSLLSEPGSLYTTPVEIFSSTTVVPPTGMPCPTTATTASATTASTTITTTAFTSTITESTASATSPSAIATTTVTTKTPASTTTPTSTTTETTASTTTETTASTTPTSTTTETTASTTPTSTTTETTASTTPTSTTTETTASTTTETTASTTPTSTTTETTASTTPTSTITAGTASTTASATTFMPTWNPTTASQTPTTDFKTTSIVTSPVNISELYFQVKANVTLTGNDDHEETISIWLNSSLPDDLMMVIDLELLPKSDRQSQHQQNFAADAGLPFKVSRNRCIFQVQVIRPLSAAQEMAEQLRKLLLTPYYNGSVAIVTEDVKISRILVYKCDSKTHQTRRGLFVWPDTPGGRNVTQECPKNPSRLATRHCKLCLSTYWIDPDLEDCPLVVERIADLEGVKVTSENALDILDMIEELLRNDTTLNYQELVTVLNKLKDIINLNVVTMILGQALIEVISDILESDSNLMPFINTILEITESVGDKMQSSEGSSTLVASNIAMSVVDVVPGQLEELTFGVSSDRTGTNPEVHINKYDFNGTVAFISLPPSLLHIFPQLGVHYKPRVNFQFFGIPFLFKNNQTGLVLNTFIVSASVTNASFPIKDLTEEVKVTLHHLIPNTLQREVRCVYWDYNKDNGEGEWDDSGCRKEDTGTEYTTCLCDHLTHFGVLMDVSRTPLDPYNEQILTVITYVGCGLSSLFLGVTVLTYTVFDKLRRDYPSQILINLCLALLGLNLVFLINSWLSSWEVYGLCVAVATLLHYFLLASFTWMGLEAVNMYFALVKVFNIYVPSYILKFCALGWGLPLVLCILVLIVNREAYGSHIYTDTQSTFAPLDNSDHFCWLQDDVTFYVSVVAYSVLIFLFNVGIFIVVLTQIRRMRANSPAGTQSGLMHDLKGISSLTLLLGLTWTAGFFTWGPARIVLLYLFAALNSLQGLFIFLFHCLMKENVRKQWRVHLCFGRFRLDEYSEWSNTASVRGHAKPRRAPPKPRTPSVRSIKSSSTDSTSASSNSSHRDTSCKRPDLGLFVNPMVLP